MPHKLRFFAVVPAAGAGRRMATEIPKQYLKVLGKTLLEHTLGQLLIESRFEKIIVPVAAADSVWPTLEISARADVISVVGGRERCDSVLAGLQALAPFASDDDWVLVHDVARPCITGADIQRLIDVLCDQPVGGLLAVPVSDTIKQVDERGQVMATVDRQALWQALTPQMFRFGLLKTALERSLAAQAVITDEASAIEWLGYQPVVVEGRRDNIKVTRPEDLALVEFYLQRLQER